MAGNTSATLERVRPDAVGGLTAADLDLLGRELDAIRQEVLDARGDRDAAYIRRLVKVQRIIELGSRAVLLASRRRVP
ncbi:MAG: hypothetical protein KDB43_16115, partial [Nocardioidaceae bacterium]|nr:hypothetical protein [Nocardioidaceae bacterium]